jgi:hypothetical protein
VNLNVPGITRRDFLLTPTEAQFIRDLLNNCHWSNTRGPKMRLAQKVAQKLDGLTHKARTL